PMLAKKDVEVLKEPNEVVISRFVADQYFPGAKGNYQEVLGKELMLNNYQDPFSIVGISEDVPANSFLQFNVLVSYSTFIRYQGQSADDSWTWSDFWHFLELQPGTDIAALEAKFPA